jgi:hypothetical protein
MAWILRGRRDTERSASVVEIGRPVKDYIEHQAEHHRKRSYETEFEAMLQKSEIAFDPKEAFGEGPSCGTVAFSSFLPGTAVPGFHMAYLRH